ncbi:MAG TPA: hypothetical protein DEA55_04430 [Rhodospirillaceae bacterium]|nr:hypothetical protein [Rhodospirillaceae bacterium]
MAEENQQEEPKPVGQEPFSMRPEDVVEHLAAIIAENVNKGSKTPRPNRTELLNHLQAIFNEAREDRRSYRALRAAFSTAVGVATMLQNNIFSNIQSTSDGVTSFLMLCLFMGTGLYANKIAHKRIAELTRVGRLADERIRSVSQASSNIFDASEFVTYLELFDRASKQLKEELTEVKGTTKKIDIIPKENHEDSHKVKSEETRLMQISLVIAFLISSESIVSQVVSPREGQHVVVENISKEQHVVIDKVPVLDNGATSCPVKARVDKKGKITLEINCDKPELFR